MGNQDILKLAGVNYHLARNRKGEANQMMHGGGYNLDAGFLAVVYDEERNISQLVVVYYLPWSD